jgi:hypothetical protein
VAVRRRPQGVKWIDVVASLVAVTSSSACSGGAAIRSRQPQAVAPNTTAKPASVAGSKWPAPISGHGLPRCPRRWLEVRQVRLGAGLGQSYATVTLRDLDRRACAVTDLNVAVFDKRGGLVASADRSTPIYDAVRHRERGRFGLPAHGVVYVQVSFPNPGDFSPPGCDPQHSASDDVIANGSGFHQRATLPVCARREGQPAIVLGLGSGIYGPLH